MAVLLFLTADSIHTVVPDGSDQSMQMEKVLAASLARAHANSIKSTAPAQTTSWQFCPDAATNSMKRTSANERAGALLGGGALAWKPLQIPATRGLVILNIQVEDASTPVHGLGEL